MSGLMLYVCLGVGIFVYLGEADGDVVLCQCVRESEGEMCTFLWGLGSPLLSLLPPVGRQVSQRLAEEAKKRERFEELKQHLEQEQEVIKCAFKTVSLCMHVFSAQGGNMANL